MPEEEDDESPKLTYEETWTKYKWLIDDIKLAKSNHESRRAKISTVVKVQDESEAAMEVLRNTTRTKLSLTAPKYSNFEVLKRSSSLGGLYHPRPGSSAGKLAILQRQERNNVALQSILDKNRGKD